MESFGNRLRTIRESKKMTQADLAEKTNINQSMISAYENDKYMPSIESLRAICFALDTSVSDLDTRFQEEEESGNGDFHFKGKRNFFMGNSYTKTKGGKLDEMAIRADERKIMRKAIMESDLDAETKLKVLEILDK